MGKWDRNQLLEQQIRSYQQGVVEYIRQEWIFFDDESDEAINLDLFEQKEVQLYRQQQWIHGILTGDGAVQTESKLIMLHDSDQLRVKKSLVYSLELLLDELNDDAFLHFLSGLNSMQFSIYDCIYCYNHLSFLNRNDIRQGTNFIIFDNGDQICSVHHHFSYMEKRSDRFELTINTGKRIILEKLE
jgi:Protein of unknown function (DUF2777)